MHAGVVEEIAIKPPNVGNDLPPFASRVHFDFQPADVHRRTKLGARPRVRDEKPLGNGYQHFRRVGRQFVPKHAFEDSRFLLGRQVVRHQPALPLLAGVRAADIEYFFAPGLKIPIIAAGNRKRDSALLEALDVYFQRFRLVLLFAARVVAAVFLFLFVLFDFFVVVDGCERRFNVRAKRRSRDYGRVGEKKALVDVPEHRAETPAGCEEKPLAGNVERGRGTGKHRAGNPVQFTRGEIVKHDHGIPRLFVADRERQPVRVLGPFRVAALHRERVGGNFRRFAAFDNVNEIRAALVRKGYFFGIGRPVRVVSERASVFR